MEVKKSPKANLENKKSLFLEIGLCISLGVMILVFSMSQSKKEIADISVEEEFPEAEVIELTRHEEIMPSVPTPAQAMSVIAETIKIVDNDTKIETEMVIPDFAEELAFNSNPTSEIEVRGSDMPFVRVEDMPTFQGGDLAKFQRWVFDHVRYPEIAKQMGIVGQVVVSFVVERDGSVSNVTILKGVDSMLDKEAIRVVSASPKWEPGRQRDMPVRVSFQLPITFQLQ